VVSLTCSGHQLFANSRAVKTPLIYLTCGDDDDEKEIQLYLRTNEQSTVYSRRLKKETTSIEHLSHQLQNKRRVCSEIQRTKQTSGSTRVSWQLGLSTRIPLLTTTFNDQHNDETFAL